jgi:hypothetical protein
MTNSNHVRIAAPALASGALLFALGDLLRRLVEPGGTASATDIAAAVGQHPATWLAAALMSLAAAFFLVLGASGLVATTSAAAGARGARVTIVGAVMVAVGAVAAVGHTVAFFALYALYDKAHIAGADIKALDDASESAPLLVVLIVLFIVGMMIGSIVMVAGLRRARRVPIWSLVAAVVFVVCGSTGGVLPGIIGILAALAAFVPAARAIGAADSSRVAGAGTLTCKECAASYGSWSSPD